MRKYNRGKIIAHELESYWSGCIKIKDAILLASPGGKIIRANPSASKFFKMTEEEIISRGLSSLIDSTVFNLKDAVKSRRRNEKFFREFTFRKKTGKKFTGIISAELQKIAGKEKIFVRISEAAKEKKPPAEVKLFERIYKKELPDEYPLILEDIINAFPDIIYIYDIEKRKNIFVSRGIEKVLGYSSADIGKAGEHILSSLMHRDDLNSYLREIHPLYFTAGRNKVIEYKCRVLDKTGCWHWILSRESIYPGKDKGAPKQIFGLGIDVTESYKIWESVKEEKDFSDALLNGLPGIFYLFDNKQRYLRWNKNFQLISGYSGMEILRMSPLDFFSKEHKGLVKEKIAEVFKSGYAEVEADLISKDGTRRPYFFNGVKIKYNSLDCLAGMGIDISAKKSAEVALIQSEHLLRTFIEHTPIHLSMFDKEMKYIAVSRKVLHELKMDEKDLIGRSHYELFPNTPDHWKEAHKRALLYGSIEKCDEDQYTRPDGSTEWIRWEIRPWHEREGEIGGIIVFSEIITERKKAEQERLELIKRLIESEEHMRKSTSEKLHDQVGQNLTALNINQSYMLRNIPSELAGSELERRMKDSIDILTETGSEIRDIMVELQPPVLISYGLNSALNWGLNKFAERNNFNIVYCGRDLKERLPLDVELAYFRVFQEILHNIAKHSQAKNINVLFEEADNVIKLEVEDDGVGFNLSDVQNQRDKNSMGLVNMSERISIIGGKLEILTESGSGTKVIISKRRK